MFCLILLPDVSQKNQKMKKLFTPLFTLMIVGLMLISATAPAQTVIYNESFDYPAGAIPPGWEIQAEQPPSWQVNVSMMAGGTAPELYLGYSMAAGLSRLVSPEIDVTGYTGLKLSYLQYLINYEMDFGEIIGMDVTFDGGNTWQALWEQPLSTLNIPQDEYSYYFAVPAGATTVQYAFRYDGNCYAINLWCIDDIRIETIVNNDLLVYSLKGNITPVAGEAETYTVRVINGGLTAQDDYSVSLYKEGGELISTAQGTNLGTAEFTDLNLSWTPATGETGNTSLYAVVTLSGDEVSDNNQSQLLPVIVQPEDIVLVEIADNFTPVKFLPYNFFQLYSYTQTLYYPEEIGMTDEPITGIKYTALFDEDEEGVEINIMLGETDQENLTDAWLSSASFTEVFNGTVNFRKGLNDFFIPFTTPYTYTGRNLVIQSVKSYSKGQLFPSLIASTDSLSQRSRAAERDDEPFNPLTIPPWGYCVDLYPNITLLYSTGTTAVNALRPSEVAVYPNPANDLMYVEMNEKMSEVKFINITGQVIYREPVRSSRHEINVGSFTPGIYVLQVTTDNGLFTKKVKVQ